MSRKQIKSSARQLLMQTFISGNRNRTATIVTDSIRLAENTALPTFDYDPSDRDNSLSIEDFTHTVNTPLELYISEEENAVFSTLEVADRNGASSFKGLI